jgi:hypothetical protein
LNSSPATFLLARSGLRPRNWNPMPICRHHRRVDVRGLAFVRLCDLAVNHQRLAERLGPLEEKTEALAPGTILQPQHPHATEAGVRSAAQANDATRPAEATDRVRASDERKKVKPADTR